MIVLQMPKFGSQMGCFHWPDSWHSQIRIKGKAFHSFDFFLKWDWCEVASNGSDDKIAAIFILIISFCHYLNHVSSERTSFNLVKSHIRPSRFSCDWKFVLWIISTPGLFQWFPAQHLAQSHPNMARGIMAEGRHHSESCHHSVYSQHQTSTSITLYKAWPQNITLYKADMWPSVAWSPACNEHHHLDLNSDLAAAARHRMFTIIERDEFWPPTFMFFVMLFFLFLFFCKKNCYEHYHYDLSSDLAAARHYTSTIIGRDEC